MGIKHALVFPVTGVGLGGWHYAVVTMDWHNSYVEMMAEHGFIAFALWCLLLFGTIMSLMRLARRERFSAERAWIANYSQALGASLIAYATGSMFLGLSYWDLLYHIIVMAVLLSESDRRLRRCGIAIQLVVSDQDERLDGGSDSATRCSRMASSAASS